MQGTNWVKCSDSLPNMDTSRLSVVSVEFNQHQDQGMRQSQHGTGELTVSKLIATYKVRPLKDGECFYCHSGCGECKTVEINENNVVINGEVIEYTKVDVSSCCHSNVGIWDDKNDCDATEPAYVYKES